MESPIAQPESPYEILRRLENLVRVGTIAEVRHGQPARCRVRTGNLTTAWVPWLAQRAAGAAGNHWWPPAIGEQCLLLAPGGDLLNAVALPGVYSDANPQATTREHLCQTDWAGGDHMKHDSEANTLEVVCQFGIALKVMSSLIEMTENKIRIEAGGSSILVQPGSVVIEAGGGSLVVNAAGATGTPDVLAQGISLATHLTTGVQTGGSLSWPPV